MTFLGYQHVWKLLTIPFPTSGPFSQPKSQIITIKKYTEQGELIQLFFSIHSQNAFPYANPKTSSSEWIN